MAAKGAAKERLKAGAEGGHAGVTAYDKAQNEVRAERTATLDTIRREAKAGGAGTRLIGELSAPIREGAADTLGNLSTLGGAAAYFQDSGRESHDRYRREAEMSLAQIQAEADRDLGQQMAMLNAQRAGSGGGGGGGGGGAPLSDSEIRSRLLGMAVQARQQALGSESKKLEGMYKTALGRLQTPKQTRANYVERRDFEQQRAGRDPRGLDDERRFRAAGAVVPAKIRQYTTQKADTDQARQEAIFNITQRTYGPGLANEAIELGQMAGLDGSMLSGIIRPQDEQGYLNAWKKQGLYKPDGPATTSTYTDAFAPPSAAAQALGLKGSALSKAQGATYYDWSSDKKLQSDFAEWMLDQPTPANDAELWAKRQEFVDTQEGATGFKQNVVSSVKAAAKQMADNGESFEAFTTMLANDPIVMRHPEAVRLAVEMARPYFQAALIQRTKQIPDYIAGP